MPIPVNADSSIPVWAREIVKARQEKQAADQKRFEAIVAEAKARGREPGRPLPPGSVRISYSTPDEVAAQHAALAEVMRYSRPGSLSEAALARWLAEPQEEPPTPEARRAELEARWRAFALEAGVTPPEDILEGVNIWA